MLFYLFLLSIIGLLFYNYYYKRRNLPPGPTPLPFIGNMHSLANKDRFEDQFIQWKNLYGPIYTYWLGELPVVSISDYNDMQRYFVKHADVFSNRVVLKGMMDMTRGGEYGIIMSNGDSWREQRRFALKVLRDFGLGKNQMEERILAELHLLLERVNKDLNDDEMDFFRYSDMAVGSIINAIISGYRFTEGYEKEFDKMKKLTVEITESFSSAMSTLVFTAPSLIHVPIVNRQAKWAIRVMAELFEHIDGQIQKHLKENDYSEEAEPSDYIDAFLMERQKQMTVNGEEGHFHLAQLRNVCMDLWLAGQETTSSTITWLIAYLIRYPEVQEKLQEELDSVIGSKRIIRNSDRPDLPYTNAVIMETQRCCNLLSQNIPRAAAEDIVIDGYHYKKGTVFVPQISVLLQDPKVFPNPERFNPSRFMDENGKLKQVEELIPFSTGKRICLGEGMARMELFIFTANLFNQYKFSAGQVPPALKKVSGASSMIVPYKCRVESR